MIKASAISRTRPPAFGFTLIEVLLAIGIFSMVMAAIYSSWSAIMRGSRVGLAAAAEVQRTRVAIRSLEESLGSAVMYADNPIYYSFLAQTSGDFAAISFVARLPESFPGSGLFPGLPLRRVEFSVDEQQNLLLKQSTVLDATPALDPSQQPYTIRLAPKVSLFAMEFFDERLNEWVPEWLSTNQLPRMVRVAMNFGEKQQFTGPSAEVTLRMIPLNAIPITRTGAGRAGTPNLGGGQQEVASRGLIAEEEVVATAGTLGAINRRPPGAMILTFNRGFLPALMTAGAPQPGATLFFRSK